MARAAPDLLGRLGHPPLRRHARGTPRAHRGPAEVAYTFDVALAELLGDGVFREEQWRREADDGVAYVTIYVFDAGGETIWGATARILAELCSIVALSSSS